MTKETSDAKARARTWIAEQTDRIEAMLAALRCEQAAYRSVLLNLILRFADDLGPQGLEALRDDSANTIATLALFGNPAADQRAQLLMQALCQDYFSQIAKAAGFEETPDEAAN